MLSRGIVFLVPDVRCSALILSPNRIITKEVNSCTYCCYVRCATIIVRVGGVPWSKIVATHYNKQLGLPTKGRVIKWLVVGYCML